jgi:hypothetical protein
VSAWSGRCGGTAARVLGQGEDARLRVLHGADDRGDMGAGGGEGAAQAALSGEGAGNGYRRLAAPRGSRFTCRPWSVRLVMRLASPSGQGHEEELSGRLGLDRWRSRGELGWPAVRRARRCVRTAERAAPPVAKGWPCRGAPFSSRRSGPVDRAAGDEPEGETPSDSHCLKHGMLT